MKCKILLVALLSFLSIQVKAGLISYDWTWAGTAGYSALGTMSYSDSLDGTGIITASSISSLTIEAFSGATSLFTWDLATGSQSNPFQMSFDTTAKDIVLGGYYPTALDSVVWGDDGFGGLGHTQASGALTCGTTNCTITGAGQSFRGDRAVSDKSMFTFAQVPEPSTILLFAAALIGLGFARRRKA